MPSQYQGSFICLFRNENTGRQNELILTLYSDNNSYFSSDLFINAVEFINFQEFCWYHPATKSTNFTHEIIISVVMKINPYPQKFSPTKGSSL